MVDLNLVRFELKKTTRAVHSLTPTLSRWNEKQGCYRAGASKRWVGCSLNVDCKIRNCCDNAASGRTVQKAVRSLLLSYGLMLAARSLCAVDGGRSDTAQAGQRKVV